MDPLLGLELLLLISLAYLFPLFHRWISSDTIPATTPWVGLREEVFKTARASFRQVTNSLQTLAEGYTKVSQAEC